ncbi:MAG: hypothetical protein K0R65_1089 [Crocinitomicaceae bacterium]|jgi:hypothetical protein|nr:hypothetical protein [Crocinitomicaceae bacterium]
MRNFIFLSLLFLAACSGEEAKTDDKTTGKKLANEGSLESEMKAIDSEIQSSGQQATSMRYTKENGAFIVVNAHLNEAGKIIKIEEDYSDGDGANSGRNSFYLKDEKVFASREYYSDMSAHPASFVDRLSYYDKNQKVVKTQEKRVEFEEELDRVEYQDVALKGITMDRAKKVLDQSGEFETFFQGFVNVQALNYIIIGSKNSESWVSSVRVDYEDSFIKTLLSDPKKYLNRKVFVAFENITDPTNFQYQSYLSGKFVD